MFTLAFTELKIFEPIFKSELYCIKLIFLATLDKFKDWASLPGAE